jgi:hypothetical protein
MKEMTARQPRRTRRRVAPAAALPRPVGGPVSEQDARAQAARRGTSALHHREHHVTRDYSHVHKDLITVSVVGTAVLAFILGMSFVIQ